RSDGTQEVRSVTLRHSACPSWGIHVVLVTRQPCLVFPPNSRRVNFDHQLEFVRLPAGSSPSRCGPGTARRPGRPSDLPVPVQERPHMPGSTTTPFALAVTHLSVLPSANGTASAPGMNPRSRLDGWPALLG